MSKHRSRFPVQYAGHQTNILDNLQGAYPPGPWSGKVTLLVLAALGFVGLAWWQWAQEQEE